MSERLSKQAAQPRHSRPAPRYPTLAAAGLALGLIGCVWSDDPRPDAAVDNRPPLNGTAPLPYDAALPPADTAKDTLPMSDGLPARPYDADSPDQRGVDGGAGGLPDAGGAPADVWPRLPDAGTDVVAPDARVPLADPAGGVSAPFAPDAGQGD